MIFQDFPGPGIFKKKIQDFPGGVGTLIIHVNSYLEYMYRSEVHSHPRTILLSGRKINRQVAPEIYDLECDEGIRQRCLPGHVQACAQ